MAAGFPRRKFSAGLLVAFIDMWLDLEVPKSGIRSLEQFYTVHPRHTKTAAGGEANTLIVTSAKGGSISLRPYYDKVEQYFRMEMKRFDYPSCAPHATQAWSQYTEWLDSLCRFRKKQLLDLRQRVVEFVLANLKSQAFDPSSVTVDPPLFRRFLESFEMAAQPGERSGAVYQGAVFGFLRADNPHLQVEVDKVRVGSKRLQRVGDIDCWDGSRLAISAEVKQYSIREENVADLQDFANRVMERSGLGIIAALSFEDEARTKIEGFGLHALDVDDLINIVELWDPIKQRTAIASVEYYAVHVEKSSSLIERLKAFIIRESAS